MKKIMNLEGKEFDQLGERQLIMVRGGDDNTYDPGVNPSEEPMLPPDDEK